MSAAVVEAVLRRDRLVVLASLAALCLLAWLYLIRLSADMAGMPGASMPGMPGMAMEPDPASSGALAEFGLLAAMWIVMMIGMMLPSAAPTILLVSALERRRAASDAVLGRTGLFVGGYLLAWGAFSIAAAAAQAALTRAGLVSEGMAAAGGIFGGGVFIVAGLYEFTSLKDRCLSHCRSPLEWIARHFRPGRAGALRMGVEHGAFCIGCCWMLMLLLFVGGVMNLLWVAGIATIVLAQKLLPGGAWVSKLTGAALLASGGVLATRSLLAA